MRIADLDSTRLVNATLWLNIMDLPACRKACGFRGHTSIEFMCICCKQSFLSLVSPEAFDPESKFVSAIVLVIKVFHVAFDFSLQISSIAMTDDT